MVGTLGSFITMLSDMFSWSNRCRPGMVLDDPQTSELALRSARRKFSEPVVSIDQIKYCVLESLYYYGQCFPVFICCVFSDGDMWYISSNYCD